MHEQTQNYSQIFHKNLGHLEIHVSTSYQNRIWKEQEQIGKCVFMRAVNVTMSSEDVEPQKPIPLIRITIGKRDKYALQIE